MNKTLQNIVKACDSNTEDAKQLEADLKALLKKHRKTLQRSRRGLNSINNAISISRRLQEKHTKEAQYFIDEYSWLS